MTQEARLVLVGGPPGVGKTTVASLLADRLDARLLSSDRLRKELADVLPHEPAAAPLDDGIYTSVWNARVYAELIRRAGTALAAGESVVLDATWSDRARRARARRLAERSRVALVELCCWAPEATVEARLHERATAGAGTSGVLSDATVEVAQALRSRFEPWPSATVLDTRESPEEIVRAALEVVRNGRARRG